MTNHTALLPVEQCDRDRAADLHIADCGSPISPYDRRIEQDYRSGVNDDWNDVQAFAAHRLQAPAEAGERKTLFPPIDFGDSAALHTERLADTPAATIPQREAGEEVERVASRAVSEDAEAHLAIRSPLHTTIFNVLHGYRLSNMADEDGYPYPLVDALSNPAPADIGTGEMEMVWIADEIAEAITALRANAPEAQGEVPQIIVRCGCGYDNVRSLPYSPSKPDDCDDCDCANPGMTGTFLALASGAGDEP